MASCETDAGAADATLSWPASASCCPALTAAVGGCTRPHSAQGLLHVLAAVEPVGLQDIRYATIEPLDHAVGSRRPGLGQPMQEWHQQHPHLFHKRPYDRPGCDNYITPLLLGRILGVQAIAQNPRQVVAVDNAPDQRLFRVEIGIAGRVHAASRSLNSSRLLHAIGTMSYLRKASGTASPICRSRSFRMAHAWESEGRTSLVSSHAKAVLWAVSLFGLLMTRRIRSGARLDFGTTKSNWWL